VLLLPNFQRSLIILSFLYLYSLFTYLLSASLFSLSFPLFLFSLPVFSNRVAKVRVSTYSPNLSSLFLFLFFFILRAICSDSLRFIYSLSFLCHCLFDGGAKVSVSFILQNLSHFFSFFFQPSVLSFNCFFKSVS
jgi:hypothetical protein